MATERKCPPGATQYTIAPGDALATLAERFGVSTLDLRLLNPGARHLEPGEVLCVPAVNCPQGLNPYVVKGSDTLTKLAARTRTTARVLAHINRLSDRELQTGQVLCIPSASSRPASKTTDVGSHNGPKRRRSGG